MLVLVVTKSVTTFKKANKVSKALCDTINAPR